MVEVMVMGMVLPEQKKVRSMDTMGVERLIVVCYLGFPLFSFAHFLPSHSDPLWNRHSLIFTYPPFLPPPPPPPKKPPRLARYQLRGGPGHINERSDAQSLWE